MKSISNILLVEDDEIDRMAIERSLKSLPDISIHQSSSYKDAIEILSKESIDLIITDYFLGDGEGMELIKNYAVPAIFITGLDNVETAVEAMKYGAKEYLVKDIQGNYLSTLPMALYRLEREINNIKELEFFKDRFRDLIENTSDAVMMIDAQGNFTYANPKWEELTGYTNEELYEGEVNFYDMLTSNGIKDQLTMGTSKPLDISLELTTKTGNHIVLSGNLIVTRIDGEIKSVRGILR